MPDMSVYGQQYRVYFYYIKNAFNSNFWKYLALNIALDIVTHLSYVDSFLPRLKKNLDVLYDTLLLFHDR